MLHFGPLAVVYILGYCATRSGMPEEVALTIAHKDPDGPVVRTPADRGSGFWKLHRDPLHARASGELHLARQDLGPLRGPTSRYRTLVVQQPGVHRWIPRIGLHAVRSGQCGAPDRPELGVFSAAVGAGAPERLHSVSVRESGGAQTRGSASALCGSSSSSQRTRMRRLLGESQAEPQPSECQLNEVAPRC